MFLVAQADITSLLLQIKKDKEDTAKAHHLFSLCHQYREKGALDKGLAYGQQALQLSKQLKYATGVVSSYLNMGNIYFSKGDYQLARQNLLDALGAYENMNNLPLLAAIYNSLGATYMYESKYVHALSCYKRALQTEDSLHDEVGIAALYNNMGIIYEKQGFYDQAMDSYKKCIEAQSHWTAISPNLFINSCMNMSNVCYKKNKYDLSVFYLSAALKEAKLIKDYRSTAAIFDNWANIYVTQNKDRKALIKYKKSLREHEKIKNKQGLTDVYNNIANVYEKLKKPAKSLVMYFASLQVAQEIGNQESIITSYINIGLMQHKLHHQKEAKEYLKKAEQLSVDINNPTLVEKSRWVLKQTTESH